MRRMLLLILILLLPVSSEAGYKIYLKNGSQMSGVVTYEKRGGEVIVYFSSGSMTIAERDIQKIEETATSEEESVSKDAGKKESQERPAEASAPSRSPADNRSARMEALKADLDAVNAEIGAAEKDEARLVASINEIKGRRFTYNYYQLRQMEKETEPLQQELSGIQQKKTGLIQRKASIEGELKALQ
jgi:chromosome segregation ATPase